MSRKRPRIVVRRSTNFPTAKSFATAGAVTRVVAWPLSQEMERQGITKAALAAPKSTTS